MQTDLINNRDSKPLPKNSSDLASNGGEMLGNERQGRGMAFRSAGKKGPTRSFDVELVLLAGSSGPV